MIISDRDRDRLETDRHRRDMLEAVLFDLEDLQLGVRRVGRQEVLFARRYREGPDVTALEGRKRFIVRGSERLTAGRGAAGRAALLGLCGARSGEGAGRDNAKG